MTTRISTQKHVSAAKFLNEVSCLGMLHSNLISKIIKLQRQTVSDFYHRTI